MSDRANSLRTHFGLLLFSGVIAAVLTFVILRVSGEYFVEYYFEKTGYQRKCNEKRIENFQKYITDKGIGLKDTAKIRRWEKKHPLMLMEIYRSNILLYASSVQDELLENETEVPQYAWVSYYNVTFSDGNADVVIYADDSYRCIFAWTIASIGLSILVFLFVFLRGCNQLIQYICILCREIQVMEGGNLDIPITIRGRHELSRLAGSLDSMRKAFKEQKERENEAYQANQIMITQMSHDLRTPMTALQIYTDILKYHRCTSEQIPDYLKKIDGKIAQIKQLSENLFEYSLISKEQDIILENPCSFSDAVYDLLSEFTAYLSDQGFSFQMQLEWPSVQVKVYSPYLRRIMDNVTSNIVKYAAKDSPLTIKTGFENQMVFLSFQNRIAERLICQEGTHIGISSINTMMKKMGGKCSVSQTDSTFRLELWLPSEICR